MRKVGNFQHDEEAQTRTNAVIKKQEILLWSLTKNPNQNREMLLSSLP